MNPRDEARAIENACATARSLPDMFAEVADGLTRVVPTDAFCLNGLDPVTLGETFAHHNLRPTPDLIARFFEIETGGQDVNAVPVLARDPVGAATLHQTTGGDPARSARYRDVLRPLGLARELRVVLRDRRVPWGMVNLFRGGGSPDFSAEEVRFVASLGRTIADGVRRTLVLGAVDAGQDEPGPGVLIVDLARPERVHHRSATAERLLSGLGDADWHLAKVARQAYATGRSAQSQVCSGSGRWLTLHAEPYDGALVSVVVEPTRPADIARLVVEAYGLSAREQEIVRLLAHGHTNAEISRLLGLSPHTVGDHVKSVFGKLAVRSRTELVARLFVAPATG
ncbi:helix-turn-helix transcriptional regulator [Actinophytocola algeriensis]|uniref:DNA-binding CsgD family transcriptional regulator n=1 Tax=Actinophytocola algeriensis TaxID=1768010 RepID=A0A7W7VFG9_9PSEU|nr:helix-turn-helix transcriptional regulator [Actinophytocola algeriensis]MBB4908296.1 DNA-binding CsgD family transcriptional regulator [Actinophytocola algeriensis]MBE1480326.1 DNA-binding CsgD family transcriptional regulator [Actinophytocola algeriensis]